MNDEELNEFLKQWQAPDAPPSLHQRVMKHVGTPWWRWLLTGTVRIPVPVLLALFVMGAALFVVKRPQEKQALTIAGFEPTRQLQPRIIRSAYENR